MRRSTCHIQSSEHRTRLGPRLDSWQYKLLRFLLAVAAIVCPCGVFVSFVPSPCRTFVMPHCAGLLRMLPPYKELRNQPLVRTPNLFKRNVGEPPCVLGSKSIQAPWPAIPPTVTATTAFSATTAFFATTASFDHHNKRRPHNPQPWRTKTFSSPVHRPTLSSNFRR